MSGDLSYPIAVQTLIMRLFGKSPHEWQEVIDNFLEDWTVHVADELTSDKPMGYSPEAVFEIVGDASRPSDLSLWRTEDEKP